MKKIKNVTVQKFEILNEEITPHKCVSDAFLNRVFDQNAPKLGEGITSAVFRVEMDQGGPCAVKVFKCLREERESLDIENVEYGYADKPKEHELVPTVQQFIDEVHAMHELNKLQKEMGEKICPDMIGYFMCELDTDESHRWFQTKVNAVCVGDLRGGIVMELINPLTRELMVHMKSKGLKRDAFVNAMKMRLAEIEKITSPRIHMDPHAFNFGWCLDGLNNGGKPISPKDFFDEFGFEEMAKLMVMHDWDPTHRNNFLKYDVEEIRRADREALITQGYGGVYDSIP